MQEPGQVQQGSGEGLGGFGAKPGQAQQGSEEGSGEGLGGFLVQTQLKYFQRLAKIKRCGCWAVGDTTEAYFLTATPTVY